MRYIKRHHPIHIHGFSPSEVVFFSERFGLSVADVVRELKAAGLDSIPGGGGEILVDRIRERVAKKKAQTEEWLGVQEEAHRQGMRTSVTMMYGLGETDEDRIEHLFRVREVQARTGGFTAFICWPLQPEGTPGMSHYQKTDAVTYLRMLAMSRIVLDNVPNLQSSWVTMGHKVGQVALRFGANDYGSLMMEENVVSAAGTTHRTTLHGDRPPDPRCRATARCAAGRTTASSRSRSRRDPRGDRLRLPPLRRGPPARPGRRHAFPTPTDWPGTPMPMPSPTR